MVIIPALRGVRFELFQQVLDDLLPLQCFNLTGPSSRLDVFQRTLVLDGAIDEPGQFSRFV
ncbi:hypothetical protein CAK78_07050 [Aeromonas sp. A35_P]|nr:hypothetical protein CAK78_07050 [Aeromonas sp. A35_P]